MGYGISYTRSFSQDGGVWYTYTGTGEGLGDSCGVRPALWVYTGDIYYKKEQIEFAQEILNIKGYECGKPDGIMGQRTRKALKDYQKDHNLCVTGNLTVETAMSLF